MARRYRSRLERLWDGHAGRLSPAACGNFDIAFVQKILARVAIRRHERRLVGRFTIFAALSSCYAVASLSAAQLQIFAPTYATPKGPATAETATAPMTARSSTKQFTYRDPVGQVNSAEIIRGYQPGKIVYPMAKVDPRLNPSLARAASIAQERAYAHSKSRCWHYVKEALLAAGAVDSRPKTALAKQAAGELVEFYGFKRLPIRDPYAAPIGAVLVYGSGRAAGHVEIRTKTGFVSDFRSPKPSKRPLIGVFAKA